MSCDSCGRADGHYLGCEAAWPYEPVPEIPTTGERHDTRESECIKDGCENRRAVSKGPRPAKYCEDHKTGSKKS